MMTNNHAQHTRKDGFKIPEGYFETLDTRLFERLDKQNKQSRGTIFRLSQAKGYLTLAAAVVLLLGVGLVIRSQSTPAISTEALELHLAYDPAYTWSSELIQSFDENDIKDLEYQINVNQKEINDYVQTNIDLDYYLNY
ncbi:hypothetical protein [Myroides sp. DW712]|uniref:hypothetical protein n=1 Tax=Myroides sp. DW712 TaxID=3389800 RepID=UPI003978D380